MQIKTKVIMLVIMVAAGFGFIYPVTAQNLSGTTVEQPTVIFAGQEWGQVDIDSINDYLAGIERHYSTGIVVGLGEFHDAEELRRYGRLFPVIILSSTAGGNLEDAFLYYYYGFRTNMDLDSLYFDERLYVFSGGSIYHIRANEIIYLDPAFGTPDFSQLNHTLSDITSFRYIDMYDSCGCATLGIQIRDFRLFRGIYNGIGEKFSWRDHEGPVQFRMLGIDTNGPNEKCQIIDEPRWETRFYIYHADSGLWILVKTLPGVGYPEDWSICTGKASECNDPNCLRHFIRPSF
jgi:hypothetical protein